MLSRVTTRSLWRSCSPGVGPATLKVRSASTSPETFTSYSLHHVQKKSIRQTDDQTPELLIAGTRRAFFTIWQDDLDNAGAPEPVSNHLITDADGADWLVLRVTNGLFGNKFVCETQRIVDQ